MPRPNAGERRRVAMSRRIVLSSEPGWLSCAATFTAW